MDLTNAQGPGGSEDAVHDEDEIDIKCVLKEGRPTTQDIECLDRELSSNPDEKNKFYELLRKSGYETGDIDEGDINSIYDDPDGVPILRYLMDKEPKSLTHECLAAVLDHSSLNRRDLAFKYCTIQKLTPTYILARGKKALDAYRRALKFGKTYDKRVKVLLIGDDHVGKTSIVKALKGEEFDENEAARDGVLMSKTIKNATEKPWRNSTSRRKSSAYKDKCTEIMRQALQGGSTAPLSDDTVTHGSVEAKAVTHNTQPVSLQVDGSNLPSAQTSDDVNDEAIPEPEDNFGYDEVDNCLDDPSGIWPIIWELSGQGVHRAIHPIFMSPDAVYVLAFDLSKGLFDTSRQNCNDSGSVTDPNSEDSNLDHIMRWMDMVHSLRYSANGETIPPVILVGTHADRVDDPKSLMEALLDRFSKNTLLGDHIASHVVVDNTRSGKAPEQEDPEIVNLRRQILTMANMMPHTKREIPLKWLYIESKVQERAQSGEQYISKRIFKEEIVEKVFKLQEVNDIEQILNFLHDRGSIIYHQNANDQEGLVILDPQWLVNSLCKIITLLPNEEEKITNRNHRKQLREKGVLSQQLLDHSCRELGLDQIEQPLVSLMKRFNLLFPCAIKAKDPMYLVPCMLKAKPGENEVIPTTNGFSTSFPVYLTFKTEFVPMGLFSRLVTLIGAWAVTKSSCEQQQVYANAARFILDGKNFLALICFKSVIKLQVWSEDNADPLFDDPRFHSEIYCRLESSLETMRGECHWLRSVSWDLCAQCRLCDGKVDSNTGKCIWHDRKKCLHDDCAHYIALKCSQYYCPHARSRDAFLPKERYEYWIQALENNKNPEKTAGQSTTISEKQTLMPFSLEPALKASISSTKNVMLLAGEWGSSKGGLPTINRQLAIELAKNSNLKVTLYVTKCSEEDKRMAAMSSISIIKANERPGFDELDRLQFPPEELPAIDVVVGHGVKLGKQAQLLQRFFPECVWVQFVHTAPEELGMYKNYSCNISRGEKKHHTEVELCALADAVVAVGPKLTEDYRTYLRPYGQKKVFEITPDPSIFREFSECKQAKDDREKFGVLVFGRGDSEDFELKGFDIAAKAIAELKDQKYHLYSVGAPHGQEEEVAEKLLRHGIERRHLTVRGFIDKRTDLAKLLCEVDLAIMPSRTEGFGLTALEALAAGLPILVSANSGFAKALQNIDDPLASACIVDSEEGKVWAAAIRAVKEKPRSQRLKDAKSLKVRCVREFSWSKRCTGLMKEILALVREKGGHDMHLRGGHRRDVEAELEERASRIEMDEEETQNQPQTQQGLDAAEEREPTNYGERCDGSGDTISSTPCSPGHDEENYNSLNGELPSNRSILTEPHISPKIETSLPNEQKNESSPEDQQTNKITTNRESSTELRWRTKHIQRQMDCNGEMKKVEHSRIEGMQNWRLRNGLVLVVAVMLFVVLILHS